MVIINFFVSIAIMIHEIWVFITFEQKNGETLMIFFAQRRLSLFDCEFSPYGVIRGDFHAFFAKLSNFPDRCTEAMTKSRGYLVEFRNATFLWSQRGRIKIRRIDEYYKDECVWKESFSTISILDPIRDSRRSLMANLILTLIVLETIYCISGYRIGWEECGKKSKNVG